jgi:hypothetical protein
MSRQHEIAVHTEAARNFDKARSKAFLSEIQHFMRPDRDKMLSLNDVKQILKPRGEVYRGMQFVPINKIVGSEGRYRDFNKHFLPRHEFLRQRWEKVDMARIRDIPLPAIQLYEIGGVYFVRDGNHRVSVARIQGAEEIDAEVTSLSTEIAISPSMTVDDFQKAVIAYEKKVFYEKTRFGELTGDMHLDFTQPGSYDIIYNHILVHKYYLNEGQEEELPFDEVLVSWYDKVYSPIIKIIKDDLIYLSFSGRSPADLYVWIVKQWDTLKKENGLNYSLSDAARIFTETHGNSNGKILRLIVGLLKKIFKRHWK